MSAHSGQRKRGEACRRVIRVAGRGVRHSVMPVDELDLARMSGDIPDPTKHECVSACNFDPVGGVIGVQN